MELPFLVVHGAVVWKVLLAGFVASSLALVVWWRRRRARARAAIDVAVKLDGVTQLQEGAVVLRAKLATGTASSRYAVSGRTSGSSHELTIEHDGERVAIAGDVTVDHGSATAVQWFWRVRTKSVAVGDEVLVSGTARRRAADQAGYRDAGGWEIGDDVHVMAVKPHARPHPPSIFSAVALAAVLTLVGYGGLRWIGSTALARAKRYDGELRTSPGGADALAIAAAMPGSRDEALSHLSWALQYRFEQTEAIFQLRLVLLDLLGECRAYALYDAQRFEEALVAARGCNDPTIASHSLAFLGRFEEAWNEPGRNTLTGSLAIATGRWAEAAAAADAQENDLAREQPRYVTEEAAARYVLDARCLAAMFRSWAGDKAAFDAIAGRETSLHCSVLAALTLPEREQAAALAADARLGRYDIEDLRREQRRAIDPTIAWGEPDRDSFVGLISSRRDRPVWLAGPQLALGRTDLTARQRSRLLGRAASLRAFRGDLTGARALLDEARRVDPDDDLHDSNDLAYALLDPAATLRSDTRYVHPAIAEPVALRRGRLPEGPDHRLLQVYPDRCAGRVRTAIASAQAGDGAELAAMMRGCSVSWSTVPQTLLAVMPLVKTHREDLAAAIRLYRDSMAIYGNSIPWTFLDSVAWYRDLARAIGDTESAATWQTVFERHATVLDDRRKLIGFWLWSH